jgi:cytochrome P450
MSCERGCAQSRTLTWTEYFSSWELRRFAEVQEHEYLEGATNRYAEYGGTFQTTMFGASLFNTIDPENVKAVLSTDFHDYSIGTRRKAAFRPLLRDGIFNADGQLAAHSRTQLRPTFAKDCITKMSFYKKHVSNLLRLLPTDGQEVDLQPLFFQITMDLSTESLFGKSSSLLLTSQTEPSSPAAKFAEAFGNAQTGAGVRLCLGKLGALLPSHKFKKDLQYLEAYVDQLMEESTKQVPGTDVQNLDENVGSIVQQALAGRIEDPNMLRTQLMNVLLAGRDTTASLLSNLWFVLARRPDIWAKLKEEISQLRDEKPTYQQLNTMKYLRYCINECKFTQT